MFADEFESVSSSVKGNVVGGKGGEDKDNRRVGGG